MYHSVFMFVELSLAFFSSFRITVTVGMAEKWNELKRRSFAKRT
jgi:hypothetical protein